MAKVLLHGVGVAGFRSFNYGEPQRIGPMSGVHLVAGPNNAGKSNVLLAVERFLPALPGGRRQGETKLEVVDFPSGSSVNDTAEARPTISIGIPLSEEAIVAAASRSDHYGTAQAFAQALMQSDAVDANQYLWAEFVAEVQSPGQLGRWNLSKAQGDRIVELIEVPRRTNAQGFFADAASLFTTNNVGEAGANAANILQSVVRHNLAVPEIQTIPPFRQITDSGEGSEDSFVGDGLFRRLSRLQHPDDHQDYDTGIARFAAVNAFVRDLLEDPEARLEVAHGDKDLFLHHGSRRLPLESFGTGIHQTIILAVAASVLEEHLVCIEEPEIHLHPTMQRKLLAYLAQHTSNQYLIATHSAAMLDAAKASISAVRLETGFTRTAPAVTPDVVAELSADLGYRASDIVQSNAVIWVEGPSDRTYLRFWMQQLAGDLEEGKHYSTMFYGGSLLFHLSPEDPSVREFIALPRLNRNFAVVIDSDKTKPQDRINKTKARVKEAIETGPRNRVVWVTRGYTIENYVPPSLLVAAVAEVHRGATCRWNGERYENPLGDRHLPDVKQADKAAIARTAVALWQEDGPASADWPLDLAEQVGALIGLVRAANT